MYLVKIFIFPISKDVSPRFWMWIGNVAGVNEGNVRKILPNIRRVPVGPKIFNAFRVEDDGLIFAVMIVSKKNGIKSATWSA